MGKAQLVRDDGQAWLHIIAADGEEWQEPIAGWSEVHCLTAHDPADLGRWWKHRDGRNYRAA